MDTRELQRLNDRLGSDLGRNAFGEPIYSWRFSETEFHDMVLEDELTWVESPGGLTVCQPVVERRKLCPALDQQWFIAKWCDAGSEQEWRAKFGAILEWPRRGYLAPTNMCLGPGEDPEMTVTQEAIGKVRAERKKTFADYIAESQSAMDRADRQSYEQLVDRIGDACTAFGNIKPGSRAGGVSFPSVGQPA